MIEVSTVAIRLSMHPTLFPTLISHPERNDYLRRPRPGLPVLTSGAAPGSPLSSQPAARMVSPLLCLVAMAALVSASQPQERKLVFTLMACGRNDVAAFNVNFERQRLFFVSTTSTTSTLSTATLCFVSNTGATLSVCGRKKRALSTEPLGEEELESISPNQPRSASKTWNHFFAMIVLFCRDESELVDSGKSEPEVERDARFLLYWKTTTLTSTSTSYTTTTSLKSVECTPSGFGITVCGR